MKTVATLCTIFATVVSATNCPAQGFPKLSDLEKSRIEKIHGKELLKTFTAKVIGVSDGDTITVLKDGREQIKIRLDSIDAPESKQDFGQRSKQALSKTIFGKTVTVQKVGEDRYKRTLAFIQIDGKDVATEMVKAGYAWEYREYSQSGELPGLEIKARDAKAGLWSHGKPVAPWDWRKEQQAERKSK